MHETGRGAPGVRVLIYNNRNMKVEQFKNDRGVPVRNQFIITDDTGARCFQSYESIIARVSRVPVRCDTHAIVPIMGHCDKCGGTRREVLLDPVFWNYSRTTSKYRAQFLGESTKETEKKIQSGEYQLVNLN